MPLPTFRSLDLSGSLSALAGRGLPEPSRRVLGSLGLSNFLAIATVADEERLCGRLVVGPGIPHDQLGRDLATMGLAHRLARFDIVEVADAVAGTSHRASFVKRGKGPSKRVLYFARRAEHCEGAEWAELAANHALVGELFGYPSCCVGAFADAPRGAFDRWPSLVRSAGPFPRILNPVSFHVYGVPSLIFHFPCSLHCQASTALAQARRARLATLVGKPGVLTRLGNGIALYGPQIGIGLVTRCRQTGPDEYLMSRIDTRDAQTARTFRAAATLRLVDGRSAYVDGRVLSGQEQVVVRFD